MSRIFEILIILAFLSSILIGLKYALALADVEETNSIGTLEEDQLMVCNFKNVCQTVNIDDYLTKESSAKLWNNYNKNLDTFSVNDTMAINILTESIQRMNKAMLETGTIMTSQHKIDELTNTIKIMNNILKHNGLKILPPQLNTTIDNTTLIRDQCNLMMYNEGNTWSLGYLRALAAQCSNT